MEAEKKKIHFHYENDFGSARTKDVAFEGVLKNVERRYKETSSDFIRETLEKYMAQKNCPTCKGHRLNKEALAVLIDGKHISQITDFSILESMDFFKQLELSDKDRQIARLILKEIDNRLSFLNNVGLDI